MTPMDNAAGWNKPSNSTAVLAPPSTIGEVPGAAPAPPATASDAGAERMVTRQRTKRVMAASPQSAVHVLAALAATASSGLEPPSNTSAGPVGVTVINYGDVSGDDDDENRSHDDDSEDDDDGKAGTHAVSHEDVQVWIEKYKQEEAQRSNRWRQSMQHEREKTLRKAIRAQPPPVEDHDDDTTAAGVIDGTPPTDPEERELWEQLQATRALQRKLESRLQAMRAVKSPPRPAPPPPPSFLPPFPLPRPPTARSTAIIMARGFTVGAHVPPFAPLLPSPPPPDAGIQQRGVNIAALRAFYRSVASKPAPATAAGQQ